ncbi:hypothetical protein [Prolixibacter denitrificans]|uniref:Uncharacterized protein n=1 Tax=Prolixibacter denitrificans TaxID=1541063 RepID=A0A2P8CH94_9BACT|nr:hypothetical protein [Prolixibacter denitrificans]PSK84296.1 hypothetical protein CLV93_10281 [Prolixibacter denitrificans]GET20471.1 hypothetical protein JCM18694_07170 [Prolixibacter denitrificans]
MTKSAKTITVDEVIWDKVKEQAKKENRPISNFVETVLIRYFDEIEKSKEPGQ